MHMKIHGSILLGFILLILIACPVQAFTAKTLDISVQENNGAFVTFSYDLSWYENAVVFSRLADPGAEISKAIRGQFNKNVDVTSVSGSQVQVYIHDFATRSEKDGAVTLSTPAMSFQNAKAALDKYWFARFINPDFSPEISRVTFPDGYSAEFSNQDNIPSVRHVLGTQD